MYKLYKKKEKSPTPSCNIPASLFTQTVDLKSWHDRYFLVLMHLATHYCTAAVIKKIRNKNNKSEDTIMHALYSTALPILMQHESILMDNGGEFNKNSIRDQGNLFGI